MERLQCGARRTGRLRPRGPRLVFLLFVCAFSGLLLAVMAIVAVHRSSLLQVGFLYLQHQGLLSGCGARASLVGSVVAAQGFGCPKACAVFPDQGSNLCPLLWRAYS